MDTPTAITDTNATYGEGKDLLSSSSSMSLISSASPSSSSLLLLSQEDVILWSGPLHYHESNQSASNNSQNQSNNNGNSNATSAIKITSSIFQRTNSFNWKLRFMKLRVSSIGHVTLQIFKLKDNVPKTFPNELIAINSLTVCNQMNLGTMYCFSIANGDHSYNFYADSIGIRDDWVKIIEKTIVMTMRLADGDFDQSLHTHYVADFVANLESSRIRNASALDAASSQGTVSSSSASNTAGTLTTPITKKTSFLSFRSLSFSRNRDHSNETKDKVTSAPPKILGDVFAGSEVGDGIAARNLSKSNYAVEGLSTIPETPIIATDSGDEDESARSTSPSRLVIPSRPPVPKAASRSASLSPVHHRHHFAALSVAHELNARDQDTSRVVDYSDTNTDDGSASNSGLDPQLPIDDRVASQQRRASAISSQSTTVEDIDGKETKTFRSSEPYHLSSSPKVRADSVDGDLSEIHQNIQSSVPSYANEKRDISRRGIGLGKGLSLNCQVGGENLAPRTNQSNQVPRRNPIPEDRRNSPPQKIQTHQALQPPVATVVHPSPVVMESGFSAAFVTDDTSIMQTNANHLGTMGAISLFPQSNASSPLLRSPGDTAEYIRNYNHRPISRPGAERSRDLDESSMQENRTHTLQMQSNHSITRFPYSNGGQLNMEMVMLTRENQALSLMNEQLNVAIEQLEISNDTCRDRWIKEKEVIMKQLVSVEQERDQCLTRIDDLTNNLVTSTESFKYTQDKLKETALRLHRAEAQVARLDLENRELAAKVRNQNNEPLDDTELTSKITGKALKQDEQQVSTPGIPTSSAEEAITYTEAEVEQIFEELSADNDEKERTIRELSAELERFRRQIEYSNAMVLGNSNTSQGFSNSIIAETPTNSPSRARKLTDNEVMALVNLNESLQRQVNTLIEQRADWERSLKDAAERSSSRTRLELLDESTISVARVSFLETIRKQLEGDLLLARQEENSSKQLVTECRHQIDDLSKRLEEFEDKNKQLMRIQTEFEATYKEYASLKAENLMLTTRNEALISDAINAIADREAFDHEIVKLKSLLREREHKQLIESEDWHQKCSDLESKINALTISAGTTERKLSSAKSRIERLSEELEEAHRGKALLSTSHQQLQKEYDDHKHLTAGMITEMQEKCVRLEREASGEVQRFRRELEILERRVEASDHARSEMKAKLIEAEDSLLKESEKMYALQSTYSSLQDRFESLEAEKSREHIRFQDTLAELELTSDAFKRQVSELKVAHETSEHKRNHDAERQAEKCRELQTNLIASEAANRRLQDSLNATVQEMSLEKELSSDRLQRHKSTTDNLFAKVRDLEKSNSQLESELRTVRESNSITVESLRTELAELRSETSTQTTAMTFIKRAYESSTRTIQDLTSSKLSLEDELAAATLQIKELRLKFDGLTAANQSFRHQVEALQDDNALLRASQSTITDKSDYLQQVNCENETELGLLREQLSNLQTEKREIESRSRQMELKLTALSAEHDEISISSAAKNVELQQLEGQLSRSQVILQEKSNEILQLENELRQSKQDYDVKCSQWNELIAAFEENTSKVAELSRNQQEHEISIRELQFCFQKLDANICRITAASLTGDISVQSINENSKDAASECGYILPTIISRISIIDEMIHNWNQENKMISSSTCDPKEFAEALEILQEMLPTAKVPELEGDEIIDQNNSNDQDATETAVENTGIRISNRIVDSCPGRLVHTTRCVKENHDALVLALAEAIEQVKITQSRADEASGQAERALQAKMDAAARHSHELQVLQEDINQYMRESDALVDNHNKELLLLKKQHERELSEIVVRAEKKIIEEAGRLAGIFEEQAAQFTAQKQELQSTMESMAVLVANDKARIEAINTEFMVLRQKISDTETSSKAKDETISTLRHKIQELACEKAESEERLESQGDLERKQVADNMAKIERECNTLRLRIEGLQQTISRLEENNSILSDEKVSLHGVISFLRDENTQLQSTLTMVTADKVGLQETTLKFVIEIGELKAEIEKLERKCDSFNNQFQVSVEELENTKANLELAELRVASELRKRTDLESMLRKKMLQQDDIDKHRYDDLAANSRRPSTGRENSKQRRKDSLKVIAPTHSRSDISTSDPEHGVEFECDLSISESHQSGNSSVARRSTGTGSLTRRMRGVSPTVNPSVPETTVMTQLGRLSREGQIMKNIERSTPGMSGNLVRRSESARPAERRSVPDGIDTDNRISLAPTNSASLVHESRLKLSTSDNQDNVEPVIKQDSRISQARITSVASSAADVIASRKITESIHKKKHHHEQDHHLHHDKAGSQVTAYPAQGLMSPEKWSSPSAEIVKSPKFAAQQTNRYGSDKSRQKELYIKQWAESTSQSIDNALESRGWKPGKSDEAER